MCTKLIVPILMVLVLPSGANIWSETIDMIDYPMGSLLNIMSPLPLATTLSDSLHKTYLTPLYSSF